MQSGFSFKGKHSSEFGITASTKSRPLIPEQKVYEYETPNMDGSYDMTAINPYGREFYKDRLFEIEMRIRAPSLAQLQQQAAKTAAWLCGAGELIFDDATGCKWQARVSSNVSFVPEHRGKTATMNVVFKVCMGEATFNTADGVNLGDAVALDSVLPLDLAQYFTFSLPGDYKHNWINFRNIGDFYDRPIFEFVGLATDIKIYKFIPGKQTADKIFRLYDLLYTKHSIDFEHCTVVGTDGNGKELNMMHKVDGELGDFFEFSAGNNSLCILVDKACTLNIKAVPKTMYDFDFSQLNWG